MKSNCNKYLQPKSKEEINSINQNMVLLEDPFEIMKAFWDGIPERNQYEVALAIRTGFKVNEPDDKGTLPVIYAAVWDNPEALKLLIESGVILDQKIVDELYDIAIFQVEPRVYNIARILAEMNLYPSLEYLEKISERVTRFINEAWGNYISSYLLKVFPRECITKPTYPVNLSYKEFHDVYIKLLQEIEIESTF